MGAPLRVIALLGALAWASLAAQAGGDGGTGGLEWWEGMPLVEFSQGRRLDELPGQDALQPAQRRTELNITLTPATIRGPVGSPTLLHFTNALYRDDATGAVFPFGPTLRVRAGDAFCITLANNLTAPGPASHLENGFHDPASTNLHVHGLHTATGVASQETAATYQGHDNVFVTLEGKPVPEVEPAVLAVTGSIPANHMPGLHWYHPHRHGSSSLQTFTANGLIVVEDDPAWLPDENGCAELRNLLEDAPDVLLHLELLTFSPPRALYTAVQGEDLGNLEDSSPQFISNASTPQNNLCCDLPGQAAESFPLLGTANSSDLVLINGGYQPVIPMQSGRYQRWRLANTGYRRFLDLQILDPATGQRAPQCELLLLAKDGLYLMAIPRRVDHIFLSNANRAELLVKCSGQPGQRYTLAAGAEPSPFGAGFGTTIPGLEGLVQPVVATLEIQEAAGAEAPEQPTLALKGCTPLRPSYASDLRDSALVARNATGLLVSQKMGFTFEQGYGCTVNGKKYRVPDPDPITLELGTVEHWEFGDVVGHPVHLHTNPVQIVRLDPGQLGPGMSYSSWFEEGDWHDTVHLPMMRVNLTAPASAGLRVQPGGFAGYTLLHCHRQNHEDEGCSAVVKYACPGYDAEQPLECEDFEYPVPGTFDEQ